MGNSQGKETSTTNVEEYKQSPYVMQILEARQKLTGWERVKLIFERDDFGGLSPELQRLVHTVMISMVVGGLIGALGRGRIAHSNFLKNHAHEVFETPLEAKRKLQDSVTLGMGSGAYRIGWRITLFTTIYMSVSTLVSTYRGKMGILDQVAGAATAGFVYKLPQGPKAQVAGTLIGGLLGLSAGIMTTGLTKLTGETIDSANLRYYHYLSKKEETSIATSKSEKELLRNIDRPHQKEIVEYDELTRFHEEMIAALEVDTKIRKETVSSEASGNVESGEQKSTPSDSSSTATSNAVQIDKSPMKMNESKGISDTMQTSKSSSNNEARQIVSGKT